MKRFLLTIVVLAVLLAGGAFGVRWWFHAMRDWAGPLPKTTNILVQRGGLDRLATSLAEAGAIDNPLIFKAIVWTEPHEGALRAAEYTFPEHASLNQVLAILRTGKPVEHHITIPEGLTAHQIATLLGKADAMLGDVGRFEEGSILPETYAYEYGATRDSVLGRARTAMTKALAAAWAGRALDLPLATPRDALILASIVERETAKPDERAHVAAVYENRLKQRMKLQADPTVVYAASGGAGVLDHPLTRAELDAEDPFNTYRVAGLPPGPICAPSVASIQAVLHPAQSDDLYFVADGTGGHVFAATLDAHERNVAKWRATRTTQ
jgi:UPF0755 protein